MRPTYFISLFFVAGRMRNFIYVNHEIISIPGPHTRFLLARIIHSTWKIHKLIVRYIEPEARNGQTDVLRMANQWQLNYERAKLAGAGVGLSSLIRFIDSKHTEH